MTIHALRRPVLVLASLVFAACGDDGDGTAYESSCDKACERMHACDSNVVVDTCASDCKRDAANVGPQLSQNFLAGLDACIGQLSCVQLAATTASQACQGEAAARLAPSGAAVDLCNAVVASVQMCLGISVGTAGCLGSVKIFSDSALISARTCDKMSCDQRGACLQTELGTDPTDMIMQ